MRFLFLTIMFDDLQDLQNSVYLDKERVLCQSISPCEYKAEKDNVGIHITEAISGSMVVCGFLEGLLCSRVRCGAHVDLFSRPALLDVIPSTYFVNYI